MLEMLFHRNVAQTGSAPEWGSGGRRFKSSRSDQLDKELRSAATPFFWPATAAGSDLRRRVVYRRFFRKTFVSLVFRLDPANGTL